MRITADHFVCMICGGDAYQGVLCLEHLTQERERQKSIRGSVTMKQYHYIEHLLLSIDSETSREILYGNIENYEGDLENISCNEAGKIIAKILELKEQTG